KIVSAESPNNFLVQQNPALDKGLTTDTSNEMMYLSGTSMSTPVAAGAAAMLISLNPNLTPNLVKMILMYTAQPLAGANHLEQGAGELNIAGAGDLAKLVRTDLSSNTAPGAPLLTTSAPCAQTTLYNYTFNWSGGVILDQTYGKGTDLITKYQKVYALGVLLG